MNILSEGKNKQAAQLVNQAIDERTKKLKEDFKKKRNELVNRQVSTDSGSFIHVITIVAGDWLEESVSYVWSRISELLQFVEDPSGLAQEVEKFVLPHVNFLERVANEAVFERTKGETKKELSSVVKVALERRKDAAWFRLHVDAGLLEAKLEKVKLAEKQIRQWQTKNTLITAGSVVVGALIGAGAMWLFQDGKSNPIVEPLAAVVERDTTTAAIAQLDSTAATEPDSIALD